MFRRLFLLVLILVLPVRISSDTPGALTLINGTEYFVHAIVDGQPHLYLAPGSGTTIGCDGVYASVTIFYAPAQGVDGEVTASVQVRRYTKTGVSCGLDSENDFACEDRVTDVPLNITWEVTEDDLEADAESEGLVRDSE